MNLSAERKYDYGVDGEFEEIIELQNGRLRASPFKLAYQAKATVEWWEEGDYIVYDLEATAYNDIVTREEAAPTLILLLLCLPKEEEQWHSVSHAGTIIRNCCYWEIFAGEPTPNTSRKRVRIPKENLFTPQALINLMTLERDRLSRMRAV